MHAMQSNTPRSVTPSGADTPVRSLVAQSLLTTDNRLEFRRLALEAVEIAASSGQKVVEINLGAVIEIDASGLGVLILAQKRARERGMRLRLSDVPLTVASLLDATRLEPLFEVVRAR
jgi:anti-anti-sigma factor